MVLPILIRTTEAGLTAVNNGWRQGAAALGLSKSAALWQILLPAAAPSIAAGMVLGGAVGVIVRSHPVYAALSARADALLTAD